MYWRSYLYGSEFYLSRENEAPQGSHSSVQVLEFGVKYFYEDTMCVQLVTWQFYERQLNIRIQRRPLAVLRH